MFVKAGFDIHGDTEYKPLKNIVVNSIVQLYSNQIFAIQFLN